MTHAHIMQPLQGETLLCAWEQGSQQPRAMRALALLGAGCELHDGDIAALGVPERDAALLALRRRSFGEALQGFAECEACGERLEFTLPTEAVAEQLDAAAREVALVQLGSWSLTCRFATTADIVAAAAEPELAAARQVLLARCVSAAQADGHAVTFAALPPDVQAEAEARLAAMHETAELSVALPCPGCDATQAVTLDLTEFLWAETQHAARRLLADVHELAWAYGWSQHDILAMAAPRRAAYLTMVRG